MTYKKLKKMFDDELSKGMDNYLAAPQRRGYSRLAGQSIDSKSDVSRATNANLRYIESVRAEMFADKPCLIKEDDEQILTPS